jgi:uncharacterized membrane protein
MTTSKWTLTTLGLLTAALIFLTGFNNTETTIGKNPDLRSGAETLKFEAYEILKTKCNTCHKKQNPWMVFSMKNLEKRAPKIYEQVFIKKRMPKGNDIRLTQDEYLKLENWLKTKI